MYKLTLNEFSKLMKYYMLFFYVALKSLCGWGCLHFYLFYCHRELIMKHNALWQSKYITYLQYVFVDLVNENVINETVYVFSFAPAQVLVIQTPATTEELVRSVRLTEAIRSLVTCASVHKALVEFTASTVSVFCL